MTSRFASFVETGTRGASRARTICTIRFDERARGVIRRRGASPPSPSSQPPRPDPAFESIPIDIIIVFSPPRRRSRFAIHRARGDASRPRPRPRRREKLTAASHLISPPSSRRVSLVTRRRRRRRIGRAETRREPRRLARPPSTATSVDARRGTVRCPRAPTTEARRARRWTTRTRPRSRETSWTREKTRVSRDLPSRRRRRVARTREGNRWWRRSGDWRGRAARRWRTIRACERYDESSGDTEWMIYRRTRRWSCSVRCTAKRVRRRVRDETRTSEARRRGRATGVRGVG